MCSRQIMSVADAAEILGDAAEVKKNPHQLVAVPMGALLAMLRGNLASLHMPNDKAGLALKMAVQAADEVYGVPTSPQHVPPPMPDPDMELAEKILDDHKDVFAALAK